MSQITRPQNWKENFICLLNIAVKKAGSRNKLCKQTGISYPTLLGWFRGAIPKDEKIRILEKYIL